MCLDKRGWGDWEDGGCSPSGEVYVFSLPSSFPVGPLATLLPLAVVLLITLLATALPSIVKQL